MVQIFPNMRTFDNLQQNFHILHSKGKDNENCLTVKTSSIQGDLLFQPSIVYFCTFDTFSVQFVTWHRLNYVKFLQECIFELECTTATKWNFRQKSYTIDYSKPLPESIYFSLPNYKMSACLEKFGPSKWDVTTF